MKRRFAEKLDQPTEEEIAKVEAWQKQQKIEHDAIHREIEERNMQRLYAWLFSRLVGRRIEDIKFSTTHKNDRVVTLFLQLDNRSAIEIFSECAYQHGIHEPLTIDIRTLGEGWVGPAS